MQTTSAASRTGYTATAKWLHWLMVLLLAAQYAVALQMPHIGRDTRPDAIINLHFSLGVLVLAVAVLRLIWRLTHAEPQPLVGLPPWQIATARVVHWLLYALLFVQPILGWLNASFRGFPVTPFGLLTLPQLVATRAPEWAWTGDVHITIAYWVMLPLIGLHVLAALYHWLIRKDRVVHRMLPERAG